MYGEPVNLTFQNKARLTSSCGTMLTFLTLTVFMIFLVVRSLKLVSLEDPFFSMMTIPRDATALIDLKELGFLFAIQKIDERLGRLEVTHTSWDLGLDKVTHEIPLENCVSLYERKGLRNLSDGEKVLYNSVLNERANRVYLCPDLSQSNLSVRGRYAAQHFDYLRIKLHGCTLDEGCFDDAKVARGTFNFFTLKAHASILNKESQGNNVIEYSVDQTYFRYIVPNLTQSTNYFFKQSEVVINDSLFDMLNSHEKSYQMYEEKVRDNYVNVSTRGDGKISER